MQGTTPSISTLALQEYETATCGPGTHADAHLLRYIESDNLMQRDEPEIGRRNTATKSQSDQNGSLNDEKLETLLSDLRAVRVRGLKFPDA